MSSRSLLGQAAPSSRWIVSLVLIVLLSLLLALTLVPSEGTVQADTVSTTVAAGTFPSAAAVNPVTNQVYVANSGSANVTVITPSELHPSPLTTAIMPLPGNISTTAVTTFNFTATSAFTPTAPPVQHIYYQVDTQTGAWLRAAPDGPSASGDTPPLLLGTHILFAFATDGQEATSINTGRGSSPILGQVSAYVFTVLPPPTVCGDQNDDGNVDIFDVIIDLQIIVGLVVPTEEQQKLSDVVRDGQIDIFDVILTLQHIVGLTEITECGPP